MQNLGLFSFWIRNTIRKTPLYLMMQVIFIFGEAFATSMDMQI